MIELLREPLSLEHCLAAVRRDDTGGIVTFVGTVRGVSEGKQVDFLEYEAYESQVVPKLAAVAAQARARWATVGNIALLHRIGPLQVTEAAVVVAVSAPHRDEAFVAARFCIDALKQSVPIWKKEVGTGGEEWVGLGP